MSILDGFARWCASRPLLSAVIFSGLVTVPTAYGLEQRMDIRTDENAEKIEEVQDEVDDEVPDTEPTTPVDDEAPSDGATTSTTGPGTTQPSALEIPDERILQIITEFCRENDCRPIFVDERETQDPEIQDPEIQNPELGNDETQDPEIQDPEIQEAPIPGPAGPSGPACPAGFVLRQVRIPSVSNQMIFLVCARG